MQASGRRLGICRIGTSAEREGHEYICLDPGCSESFSTPDLLHYHVEAHFQGRAAQPVSDIDNTQTNSDDGNATVIAARANLINLHPNTALMSGTTATAISSSGPTQASSNVGTPTCAECRLTFSRPADLHRHSGVHLPERRKYCCVVKGCEYKGSYRKDKLTSHVKNRHGRVPRKGMI